MPKSRNFFGAIEALGFFFCSVCSKVKFPIKLVLAAAEIPPVEAHVLGGDCGMCVSAGSGGHRDLWAWEMLSHSFAKGRVFFSELKTSPVLKQE